MIDWRIYNEGLVKRGEVLFDFDLFDGWQEELTLMNEEKPGRPFEFPDTFIQFLFRLKSIFKIDYRTLEGITRKLVVFIQQSTASPDYTTLQVRFGNLSCQLEVYEKKEEQEIAGDSTGLKTSNRGEYRMSKYRGERKQFVKLHIAVNTKTDQVVSWSITQEEVRDHKEMPNLISQAQKHGIVKAALFDRGYDTNKGYWDLEKEGIKPVIKPKKTMGLKRVNEEIESESQRLISPRKDEKEKEKIEARLLRLTILKEYLQDEEGWKKENGYGKRWKAEERYSVFKRLFGEYVFSKKIENIQNEVAIKINLMNLFEYVAVRNIATKSKAA